MKKSLMKYRLQIHLLYKKIGRGYMKMKLENKVALVTDGSSGMGREIAKLLAKEGSSVVLVARKKETLEDLVNEIKADGGKAVAVDGIPDNEEDIQNAISAALIKFGKLDLIINTVNIAEVMSPVAEMGEGIWEVNLNVDLTGAI